MALVLAIDGRKRALNTRLRNLNTGENFVYHLYSNNYTPVDGSVLANFTESAFAGYASQIVLAADWTSPVDDGTCVTCTAPAHTWTSTGAPAEQAYGYFVTSSVDAVLLWAEKFAAPVDMSLAGRSTILTPTYQNKTGTPC